MWITLLALLSLIGIIFYPHFFPVDFGSIGFELASFMVLGGSLLLILTVFLNTQILGPLSRLEQKFIPNLMELFQHHVGLRIGRLLIFIISFISFFLALTLLFLLSACNPLGKGKKTSEFGAQFQPGLPQDDRANQPPSAGVGASTGFKISSGSVRSTGSEQSSKTTISINDRKLSGTQIGGRFSIGKTQVR